jgi:acetylornithine deacetylase/succinyl-diaminopimelate desuccinylase-like protein
MEPTVQKAYSSEEAKTFIEKTFDESALPSLMEFIRIPNLSRTYSNTWQTDGFPEQAANHLKKWVESMQVNGLKIEIIKHENYSPLIFIEVEGDLKHTVMYYGHYDKQPPFTGWWENFGPTTPVIKDDKLYGRGGADDGYSIYGSILAIKSLQLQGIKIPST